MTIRLALLSMLLILSACNQVAAPSEDSSAIRTGAEAWQAAMNAKDIDGLVALYTEDTRVMPPNHETVSGHDAVRTMFGGMIDAGLEIELVTLEAMSSGKIGYRVGTYVLNAGGETTDSGKYIETWRRGDDGTWRIANDAWSSDLPAAAAAEKPETHLMVVHEVDDAELWLSAWRGADSRHKLFKENGALHVHTFRSADNPNLTGLVIAVDDMDALTTMLESKEGVAAAAEDGVRADTMSVLPEAD